MLIAQMSWNDRFQFDFIIQLSRDTENLSLALLANEPHIILKNMTVPVTIWLDIKIFQDKTVFC